MDLNSGVSLGQLVFSILTVVAVGGIAWGGLLQRVKTLEREVLALSNFGERLATIEAQQGHAIKQLDKIVDSWLFKEPPPHDALRRFPT